MLLQMKGDVMHSYRFYSAGIRCTTVLGLTFQISNFGLGPYRRYRWERFQMRKYDHPSQHPSLY